MKKTFKILVSVALVLALFSTTAFALNVEKTLTFSSWTTGKNGGMANDLGGFKYYPGGSLSTDGNISGTADMWLRKMVEEDETYLLITSESNNGTPETRWNDNHLDFTWQETGKNGRLNENGAIKIKFDFKATALDGDGTQREDRNHILALKGMMKTTTIDLSDKEGYASDIRTIGGYFRPESYNSNNPVAQWFRVYKDKLYLFTEEIAYADSAILQEDVWYTVELELRANNTYCLNLATRDDVTVLVDKTNAPFEGFRLTYTYKNTNDESVTYIAENETFFRGIGDDTVDGTNRFEIQMYYNEKIWGDENVYTRAFDNIQLSICDDAYAINSVDGIGADDALTAGEAVDSINIRSLTADTDAVKVLVGLYKNNTLLEDVRVVELTPSATRFANQDVAISNPFSVPESAEDYSIKAFVFDTLGNIKPLSKVVVSE